MATPYRRPHLTGLGGAHILKCCSSPVGTFLPNMEALLCVVLSGLSTHKKLFVTGKKQIIHITLQKHNLVSTVQAPG